MPKQSMMNLFLTATPDGNNKTLLSHVVVSIFTKIVKMCLAPKRINHLLRVIYIFRASAMNDDSLHI